MNLTEPVLSPRNPRDRGAPIIPRRDWDYPPWHRWTFQHIREMTATEQIWRGGGTPSALPDAPRALDDVGFTFDGAATSFGAFIETSFTDGMLVIQDGAVVYERYMNGLRPHVPHLCMSVTKSVVGTLASILEGKGIIDPNRPVADYVPGLATTAYRDVLIQHVLDMSSGVVFNESYTEDGSHMVQLDLACGWKEHNRPGWPRTMWELILTLDKQDVPHGSRFAYRSIETDILALVLEHATGLSLAELISRELWTPLGAQEDAYITVDHSGFALADGGFCATLRDMGRFAQMLVGNGAFNGRQIVPAEWLARTLAGTRYSDHYRFVLPRGAYSNTYWIEEVGGSAFMGRGIFGQFLYVDPAARFAAVKFSTWPEFASADRSRETLAAFGAIKAHLAGQG